MTETVYQKLMKRLDNAPVPLCKIAEEANVAQATVSRIIRRNCKNPRVNTVDALLAWFDAYDSTSGVSGTVGNSGHVATPPEITQKRKDTHDNHAGQQNISKRRSRDWNLVRSSALGKKTE